MNAHTFILGKEYLKGALCKTKLYQRQLISEKWEAVLTRTKSAHGRMQWRTSLLAVLNHHNQNQRSVPLKYSMFLYVSPVVKLLKMIWACNIFCKSYADQHIHNVHILYINQYLTPQVALSQECHTNMGLICSSYRTINTTRVAPKVMPPILLCWPTTSAVNVG